MRYGRCFVTKVKETHDTIQAAHPKENKQKAAVSSTCFHEERSESSRRSKAGLYTYMWAVAGVW